MKKNTVKKFVEVALITLLFLGCITETPKTTSPTAPPTTPPGTTTSPAQFEITNLRVVPETPKVGDVLTILVDVQNKGDSSGSYTVLVTIGDISKMENVELEGKSSKTVQFQELADKEGTIEIKAGNLTKTIIVSPLETPPPTTTPLPTTPPTTTPKPTGAPEESKRIYEPEIPIETSYTYYFSVRGGEWGTMVYKNKTTEELRSSWFVWGNILCAIPPTGDIDEVGHQDNYTFYYKNNGLREIYAEGENWCCIAYSIKYVYSPPLPSVYSLVKGTTKKDHGSFFTEFTCKQRAPGVYTHVAYTTSDIFGRGTYDREIYVEEFENIEAGGKTYECARVKFTITYEVEYNTGEPWKLYKWVEDGYAWYSDIGMVKAEYTVKTYFSGELKKTDKVSIILNSITMP